MVEASRIANADGIEVTEEMMEAGCKVLWEAAVTEYPAESNKLVVAEIFRAMHSLLPAKEAAN